MQRTSLPTGAITFIAVVLVLLCSALLRNASATIVGLRSQILCDEGFGPQLSGCTVINKNGDFRLDLTGLPSNTTFSCTLGCDLGGSAIHIPECGSTDADGNLHVLNRGITEDFGGTCFGLRITVDDSQTVSCTTGVAGGACTRARQVNGGVATITCQDAGCIASGGSCHVIRINKQTGAEIDTGASSAVCLEPAEVCPCRCI